MPLVLTEANSSGRATRGRTCSSGSARWVWRSCCRSEEHTSELQSRLHLVCRLLLEKKKMNFTPGSLVRAGLRCLGGDVASELSAGGHPHTVSGIAGVAAALDRLADVIRAPAFFRL